jgi:hypothetical protein
VIIIVVVVVVAVEGLILFCSRWEPVQHFLWLRHAECSGTQRKRTPVVGSRYQKNDEDLD